MQSIRVAQESDAEDILRIYAPIVATTPISFETEVPSADEIRARIKTTLDQYPWLVYELGGRVVGYVYASTHRIRSAYQWSTEVTVYIDRAYHKRGIGKSLYQALFEILRRQGYYTAVAGITLPNLGSVAIHESLGFKQVGVFNSLGYKQGVWHDVGWWQLELQPYSPNPNPPVFFPQILTKGLFL